MPLPSAIAYRNVLQSDKNEGSMRVHANLKPKVKNVEHLIDLLLSDSMYLCQPQYNCIAGGLETGKIKGMKKSGRAPLESLVTLSYEAHFRLELTLALGSQGYRHQYTTTAMSARAKSFEKLLRKVKSDREEHTAIAWQKRQMLDFNEDSPSGQPAEVDVGRLGDGEDDPTKSCIATISSGFY